MNVLVTGDKGYIGTHLCYLLKSKGYKIISFDFKNDVDVVDSEDLLNVFKSHKIDAVVHLAALISVPESEIYYDIYYRNNSVGTYELLLAMSDNNCNKLIFASTAAVYDFNNVDGSLTEDQPVNSASIYGHTKYLAEQFIEKMCPKFDCDYTIFRFFNVAGTCDEVARPDRHPHLIPAIIKRHLDDKPVNVYGTNYPTKDGTCIRDYVHVMDICNAIWLALEKGECNEIINLGTNTGYSVKEVIYKFDQLVEDDVKMDLLKRREGDPPYLVASNEKAKRVLGWSPKYTLEDMISSTLKYW